MEVGLYSKGTWSCFWKGGHRRPEADAGARGALCAEVFLACPQPAADGKAARCQFSAVEEVFAVVPG